MAAILRHKGTPQRVFPYPGLENIKLGPNQVILFVDKGSPGGFNSQGMIFSMVTTYLIHHGGPIPASGLAEINKLGIFVLWGIEEELGMLCKEDLGNFFSRFHVVGETEEYIDPTERFNAWVTEKIAKEDYEIFGPA